MAGTTQEGPQGLSEGQTAPEASLAPSRLCARCGSEVLAGDEDMPGSGFTPLRHKDLLCLVYLARKSAIVMVPDSLRQHES